TGIVGLILFLVVVLGSLRASWLAAQRFEAAGETRDANLARSILIGTVGMLAAMFFISDGGDLRLWVLFALGPVLLSLASRTQPRIASEGAGVGRAPARRAGVQRPYPAPGR